MIHFLQTTGQALSPMVDKIASALDDEPSRKAAIKCVFALTALHSHIGIRWHLRGMLELSSAGLGCFLPSVPTTVRCTAAARCCAIQYAWPPAEVLALRGLDQQRLQAESHDDQRYACRQLVVERDVLKAQCASLAQRLSRYESVEGAENLPPNVPLLEGGHSLSFEPWQQTDAAQQAHDAAGPSSVQAHDALAPEPDCANKPQLAHSSAATAHMQADSGDGQQERSNRAVAVANESPPPVEACARAEPQLLEARRRPKHSSRSLADIE